MEEGVKHLVLPSVVFEDLGLRYYGPIDGHDIALLIQTFEFLKKQNEPVLLHIITQKGKGYAPAIAKPDKFHGLAKFKLETGETAAAPTPTYSELFGQTLAKFADQNNKIMAITAAMQSGTGLFHFAAKHPKQYFDVGIAEEHASLFASGLATEGFKPFLTIYSTFMQRAYDMLIHDIALQNLNVALCMDRAGLSGDDGPTHHGLFDIGYLRHIPNMVHMQAKDEEEFVDMLWTMVNYQQGPIAIRYPRGAGPGAKPKPQPKLLEDRKGRSRTARTRCGTFRAGKHVRPGAGNCAKLLEAEGVSVALINPRWIKPHGCRHSRVLCAQRRRDLHVRGSRSPQWIWLRRRWSTCPMLESRRRSFGSAGRINSSSMVRSRFCERNTASLPKPRSRRSDRS